MTARLADDAQALLQGWSLAWVEANPSAPFHYIPSVRTGVRFVPSSFQALRPDLLTYPGITCHDAQANWMPLSINGLLGRNRVIGRSEAGSCGLRAAFPIACCNAATDRCRCKAAVLADGRAMVVNAQSPRRLQRPPTLPFPEMSPAWTAPHVREAQAGPWWAERPVLGSRSASASACRRPR